MAEYEGNGDFSYSGDGGSSNFKRDFKGDTAGGSVKSDDENEESVQVSEKVNEYVRELLAEKMAIDHKYPHAEKLLDAGKSHIVHSHTICSSSLCRIERPILVMYYTPQKHHFVCKQSARRLSEDDCLSGRGLGAVHWVMFQSVFDGLCWSR